MLERKKCDDNFDREEKNVRKAVDKLLDAARACVRQAASDLARACRLVKDRDAQQLAVFLDNTQIDGGFENVRDACRLFNSSRRSTASGRNPTPLDLLVFSSLSLEDAASGLLSNDVNDLLQVGSNSVRSRASSAEVLGVLKHRRT
jgi:hypothetical protein